MCVEASDQCNSNLYKGVYDPNIRIGVEHFVEARLSIHQLQLIELLVILEQRRHSQTQRPCAEKKPNWHWLLSEHM